MEYIRDIKVKVEVDTNKRTHVLDVQCDTLDIAESSFNEFMEAVRDA